jgi:cystathionine beta-lyase family protein involved in aluminum resistance
MTIPESLSIGSGVQALVEKAESLLFDAFKSIEKIAETNQYKVTAAFREENFFTAFRCNNGLWLFR